jgi:hypothetical protein
MDPLQLFSVGIALAHACLLAGVYFSSSVHTDAFVSTEIHSLLFFRVTLTCLVFLEAILCAAYIFSFHQDSAPRSITAAAFVATAVAGWAVLACYPTSQAEHAAGAILFIVGSAASALFFITKAAHYRSLLYACWASSIATAGAFGGLYAVQIYDAAAACEWAAFTLDAITLCLFFAGNPPEGQNKNERKLKNLRQAAECAMPLLDPAVFG